MQSLVSRICAILILCWLCATPTPQEKIAFIGDSYTQGQVDTDWLGFAGRVAQSRDAQYKKWWPCTFKRAFEVWPEIVAYQPDIIVLELGIHKINLAEPDTDIEVAIPQIMHQALAITPRVVFVTIPWRVWGNWSKSEAIRINEIIRSNAAQLGVMVADSHDALAVCGMDCIGYDGTHPNATGHQIIADSVLEVLVRRVFIPVKL